MLSREKEFEEAQSQERPPPGPPMPEFSTMVTITNSTADGQYVATHSRTEDDQVSPDSAGSSTLDPRKLGRR
jgi:hypothetical protein